MAQRPAHAYSVAPMMEWTDRHYRFMCRFLTRRAKLYTEMVVDDTILHRQDDLARFLGHDPVEQPLALQLGGSDPEKLGEAAAIAEGFGGFCEINLNCGCPSPRVSRRCFGARLMLDPERVATIVQTMKRRATMTPITVKCRIGADDLDTYEDLSRFVGVVRNAGCDHFIVHARKCLLDGLSAHQNRNVPPLRPWLAHRLARDFPEITVILNGGITDVDRDIGRLSTCTASGTGHWDWESEAQEAALREGWDATGLRPVHGIMVGRHAYQQPWDMRHLDSKVYGAAKDPGFTRRQIVEAYGDYADRFFEEFGYRSSPMKAAKPVLGLFAGVKGGRAFRRIVTQTYEKRRSVALARLAKNNHNTKKALRKYRTEMWQRLSDSEDRKAAEDGCGCLEEGGPTSEAAGRLDPEVYSVKDLLLTAMEAVPDRVLDAYDEAEPGEGCA